MPGSQAGPEQGSSGKGREGYGREDFPVVFLGTKPGRLLEGSSGASEQEEEGYGIV